MGSLTSRPSVPRYQQPVYTTTPVKKEPAEGSKDQDMVNSPPHYMLFPDMEAIDAIQAILTPDEYQGYLKGNALKYRMRAGKKDDTLQDVAKAGWYENRLQELENDQRK